MLTAVARRLPDEVELDSEPVPGSWLRLIGRFTYTPGNVPIDMIRVRSGVCYHAETNPKVIEVLETYMGNRSVRLSLNYGDVETGKDWLDEYDMEGYIGHSMGPCMIPLLISTNRSMGGSSILDHCIIRIKFVKRSLRGTRQAVVTNGESLVLADFPLDLYRHPTYDADRDEHRQHITDPVVEQRVWDRRFT